MTLLFFFFADFTGKNNNNYTIRTFSLCSHMPSIIDNPALYEKAKKIVYKQYPKHSAYRSGQLVKLYKEMGGTYSGKKENTGLTRWFKEEWKDVSGIVSGALSPKRRRSSKYPVYRPTKRVTKKTPLTVKEISPANLSLQIKLKQQIKGDKNLPPFKKTRRRLRRQR